MGLYDRYVLPRLLHVSMKNPEVRKQRARIVPAAAGRVLEIGIGSGLNIPYYDPGRVDHLWGLDPSREMWAIADRTAHERHLDVEFIQSGAESIPLDSACADTVVVTYTLCSITCIDAALEEMRRVLKPGGRLVFCEHGEAPDDDVRRWQRTLDPAWKRVAGGCHLGRPIPRMLEAAGFFSTDMQSMYIPGWRPGCFNYWGTARPR